MLECDVPGSRADGGCGSQRSILPLAAAGKNGFPTFHRWSAPVRGRSTCSRRSGGSLTPGCVTRRPSRPAVWRATFSSTLPSGDRSAVFVSTWPKTSATLSSPSHSWRRMFPGCPARIARVINRLAKHIQEYAGAENKAALIRLLSPLHAASGKEQVPSRADRLRRYLPSVGVEPRRSGFARGEAGQLRRSSVPSKHALSRRASHATSVAIQASAFVGSAAARFRRADARPRACLRATPRTRANTGERRLRAWASH